MASDQVRLLGRASLSLQGEWFAPPATQAAALLFHLAHQQRWVNREEITYLFWPDRDESRARNSLRYLVHSVKRSGLAPGLEVEPTRLQWRVTSDLARFRDDALDLGTRVASYGGWLLDGFTLGRAPEFDNWLDIERQTLHEEFRTLAERLADALATGDRLDDAGAVLDRVLELDPLDERVMRRRLDLLQGQGRLAEAERRSHVFARRLRQEFGDEPSGLLVEPHAQHVPLATETGRSSAASPRERTAVAVEAVRRYTVAAPVGTTVGRHAEIAEIRALLTQDDCRLVTLLAPGGMGKSRLAVEVARDMQASFEHGACLVQLVGVTSEEELTAVLLRSLAVPLYGPAEPLRQLANALQRRRLLLVLDNLEQIGAAARLVEELLGSAPDLKVLATSRTLLGTPSEWVYEVRGLGLATHAEGGGLSEADTLFAARARQLTRDFEVTPANRVLVSRVTRVLGGMPLAIELAATWLRALGLAGLVEELGSGLGLAVQDEGSFDTRHRSLRAVLDGSWESLSPTDQAAMRRLSVFPTSFDRQAAWDIAEVSLPTLLSLVNRAFLLRSPTNRFERHPLITELSLERAAARPDEQQELRGRHARHYLGWVGRLNIDLHGERQGQTIDQLEQDDANLRTAWRWAAVHEPEWLAAARLPLRTYSEVRRRWDEWRELVEFFDAASEPGSLHRARARLELALLAEQAAHATPNEAFGAVEALALEALPVAEQLGAPAEVAEAYHRLGNAYFLAGRLGEAVQHLRSSEPNYAAAGDDLHLASIRGNLGIVYSCLGDYPTAASALHESSESFRSLGACFSYGNTLHNWVHLEIMFGNYLSALRMADEMLALERRSRDLLMLVERLGNSARVNRSLGRLTIARSQLEEGIAVLDTLDDDSRQRYRSWLRSLLGTIALSEGSLDEARTLLEEVDSPRLIAVALAQGDLGAVEELAVRHLPDGASEDRLVSGTTAWLQTQRAEAALKRGDLDVAHTRLVEAMQAALEVPLVPAVCDVLPTWAEYLVATGRVKHAAVAAALAATHTAATFDTRQYARAVAARHAQFDAQPRPEHDDVVAFGRGLLDLN